MTPVKDTRIVIMAGGKGTRLRPFTVSLPKPLVPVGELPILEILLRQLYKTGFRKITLTLGYLGGLIEAYLSQAKGPAKEMEFTFVHEGEPTGTAGSLGLVEKLDSTFIVMNGDILTDLDYLDLLAFHARRGADVTVAVYEKKVKIELGVIEEDEEGWLCGFEEKPTKRYMVGMGVVIMEPTALEYVVPGEYLDLPTLLLKMLGDGRKIAVYHHQGLWLDIGNHDDFAAAQEFFETHKALYHVD